MYGPGYGSNPNVPPTFNNAAPPPHHNHNPHLPPGALPSQQQPQMYNPNQFAGGMPQGQQPSFSGGSQPNPAMMSGPGPAGMMQSTAMPPMPTNGQPSQMPYPNQQFQGNAAGQQFPPNYMAAGMSGFPANSNMTPQQQQQLMQQRMQQHQQHQAQQHQLQQQQQAQQQHQQQHQHQQQQHQQHQQHPQHQQHQQQQQQQQQHHQHQQQPNQPGMAGSPTPQRPPSASHGTPNNNMVQGPQSQHSTPQTAPQGQPTPNQQQQPNVVATPQTPTFPSSVQNATANGAPSATTPLSPGAGANEREKMAVMLSINNELLYESIRMQQTMQEIREESGPLEPGAGMSREEMTAQHDYNQCMRRLQGNLGYLATMVERDRKPATLPPSPAYLTPPPLNMKIPVKSHPPGADDETKAVDPMVDREQRHRLMVELYAQLQRLYPGVDPKKEPAFSRAQGPKPGTAQASPVVAHSQGPPQTPTSASAT